MILMNLFSIFDPSSYLGWSLNWICLAFIIVIWPFNYYFVFSPSQKMLNSISFVINYMLKEISMKSYLGMSFLCSCLFFFFVIGNLMSMLPFVFTSFAHPKITLGLGLVFWMSFFFMGFMKNFINSVAHLVPEGSPLLLAPVMVVIESISHLIRPFTLSIRLAANMMAGHLIINLLSSISSFGVFSFFISVLFQMVILILELGVCIIQGFVFSILILLYALEYY